MEVIEVKNLRLLVVILLGCLGMNLAMVGRASATDIDVGTNCPYGQDPESGERYETNRFSVSYGGTTYQAMCVTPMRGNPSGASYSTKVIANPSGDALKLLKFALCAGVDSKFGTNNSKCKYSNAAWTSAKNAIGGMGSLGATNQKFVTMHAVAGKLGAKSGVLSGVTPYTDSEYSMMDDGYYALTNTGSYSALNTLASNINSWVSDSDVSGYKLAYAYPSSGGYLQTIVWAIPPKDKPEDPEPEDPPTTVTPKYETATVAPMASVNTPSEAVSDGMDTYQRYTFKTSGSKSVGTRLGIMRTNSAGTTATPFKTRTNYKTGASWAGWDPAESKKITSGTSYGSALTWNGKNLSYTASLGATSYTDLCVKLRAWDTEFKVGAPGTRVSSPAGHTVSNCISVRGPQVDYVWTDAEIAIKVTDGTGGAAKSCQANSTTCEYYATSNTLTFKVKPTLTLSRWGTWPSYLNELTTKMSYSYSATGSVSVLPTPSTDRTIDADDGWVRDGTEQTVTLNYGDTKKVCFNLGYQEKIYYNKTRSDAESTFYRLSSYPYAPTNGYAHTCVTIHAPSQDTAHFTMSGMTSGLDSAMNQDGTETRSSDGQTYNIAYGNGLQTEFQIIQGTFRIGRSSSDGDVPAEATSQYQSLYREGTYTSSPAFAMEKATSPALGAGGTTGGIRVNLGDGRKIVVPIGTAKSSRYNYTFCNYGKYDNQVDYITYWVKTDGTAGAGGKAQNSVVKSGGRHYNGELHKCYAFYNPSVTYTALFEGKSSGYINANATVSPSITRSDSNKTAIINNSTRETDGDDQGRWKYTFDNSKTEVTYTATFTHTVSLANTADEAGNIISAWMVSGSGTPYRDINTQFKVEESNDGGTTWTVLSGYNPKTTQNFTASVTENIDTNNPTFTYKKSANWGIGKYWNYCQRLSWNKSKTFETKTPTGSLPAVGGEQYSIDYGTAGSWTTNAEKTQACVVMKNPMWEETDTATLYHKINVRGYTDAIGANEGESGTWFKSGDGEGEVVLCSSEYVAVTGDACGIGGGAGTYDETTQYNMLKTYASTYFAHTIRRYDNWRDSEKWFDESVTTGREYETATGGSYTGVGVKQSGTGKNFWKNACLKTSLTGACVKNSATSGVTRKNSMYTYAGMTETQLHDIDLDNDPFSVVAEYKGNEFIESFLKTTRKGAVGSWSAGSLKPVNVSDWKAVDRLSSASLGTMNVWQSARELDPAGAESDTVKLNGMTGARLGGGSSAVKAGETKLVCNATRLKRTEWNVRYAAVNRQERYTKNGAGANINIRETAVFDRYELRSKEPEAVTGAYNSQNQTITVGGVTREGQDCMTLKRDWNYNITKAAMNVSGDTETMNAGDTLKGSLTMTVTRDNEVKNDDGTIDTETGWKYTADEKERDYITDVSGERTKASLILYSILPYEESGWGGSEDNYHETISAMINGGTIKTGVTNGNYCKFFNDSLGTDAIGECADLYNVGSAPNAERKKWKKDGDLTGSDWGYGTGTGVSGGLIGLTLDPNDIKHTGDVSEFGSDGLPRADQFGKVANATSYTLSLTLPETVRSFKMTSGSKFCVAVAIEAKSSTSNHILISESNCSNIVKNPQFSVWGGDTAAQGGISTTLIKTNNIAYGSWGDFGLIADGTINAMSSGRGLAKEGVSEYTAGQELRTVSKMTLKNKNDAYGQANAGGLGVNIQAASGSGLVDRLKNGKGGVCYKNVGNVEIGKDEIEAYLTSTGCDGQRRLLLDGNEVKIKDNIVLDGLGFGRSSSLNGLIDIPQVVIVADSVKVKENVTQVDAWIVQKGGGEVNTCAYKDKAGGGTVELVVGVKDEDLGSGRQNVSKWDCIGKLQVNGPVVGKKIALRRTQGGDPVDDIDYENEERNEDWEDWVGTEEMMSENIDYTPETMLFSISVSSDSAPSVVYMRELAPRY